VLGNEIGCKLRSIVTNVDIDDARSTVPDLHRHHTNQCHSANQYLKRR
jgi:hypothetical protein